MPLKDAQGNAPSPIPNRKRITISDTSDQANPVKTVNADHRISVSMMTFFEPYLSASHPPGSCMMA